MVDVLSGGVPIAEVTANDFMQVRAALVRRLGGANQALVFSRIYYRTDSNSRAALEVDGQMWWKASHPALAAETGLTIKQARDAIEELVEHGHVVRELHGGRAYSYRTVVIGYLPSGADRQSDLEGRSIGPVGQMYLPSEAVTPLIDIEDLRDTPIVPTMVAKIGAAGVDLFEDAWTHWPRKESKKKARDRFLSLSNHGTIARAVVAHGDAHSKFTPPQFVPHLTTWLNQERWNDPLPGPRGPAGGQTPTDRALATLALADVDVQAVSA